MGLSFPLPSSCFSHLREHWETTECWNGASRAFHLELEFHKNSKTTNLLLLCLWKPHKTWGPVWAVPGACSGWAGAAGVEQVREIFPKSAPAVPGRAAHWGGQCWRAQHIFGLFGSIRNIPERELWYLRSCSTFQSWFSLAAFPGQKTAF